MMRRHFPAVTISLAATLASCAPNPGSPAQQPHSSPVLSPKLWSPPPIPATGSANRPALQPLARGDYENELASGAGCTLRKDGEDLIAAVVGDAVAKVDGRVIHLRGGGSNYNNLAQGGRYSGGDLFVDLGLLMRPMPGMTPSTRAEVRLERGEEYSRFEAEWICGS